MEQSKIYHGGSGYKRPFSTSGGGVVTGVGGLKHESDYSEMGAASLTNSIIVFWNKIPDGAILIGSRMKVNTVWAGTGITELYLSLGYSGLEDDIIHEYRADNITPGNDEYAEAFVFESQSYGDWPDIYLTARAVGANLNNLTQGDVVLELWFLNKVI